VIEQAEINIAFPAIVSFPFVNLDGSAARFGLAFHGEDDTMDPRA